MELSHRLVIGDARDPTDVDGGSVHLVVTSPPYPMIEMWDGIFASLAPGIGAALERGAADEAFELMHRELDRVWAELRRVLVPGGIACINIGDATRTFDGEFRLFSNHARILAGMARAGFVSLPDIIWRKPTNAPNKFMGSGMLPAGAYVTYEHEYILVFRNGSRRAFQDAASKELRRRSAYFWEERNIWFSDVWIDLPGTRQALGDAASRSRSAAYPIEVPWRLIHMFSVQGDTVLDPFAGMGTTLLAAASCGRASVGVERDPELASQIGEVLSLAPSISSERISARLSAHRSFLAERAAKGRPAPAHTNRHLGFPVVTSQETEMLPLRTTWVRRLSPTSFSATHAAATAEAPPAAPLTLPFEAAEG